jgi:hypothetical protein
MAGMEKKDERLFLADLKGQQMNPGDRVVRRQTKDRALFFVISGTFMAIGDGYPLTKTTYKTGTVIGAQQFLHDDYWEMDLICNEEGIIAKYEY